MMILAVEGVFSGLSLRAPEATQLVAWQSWRLIATAALIGPWILFSYRYARGTPGAFSWFTGAILLLVGVVPLAIAVVFHRDLIIAIRPTEFAFQTLLGLGWPALTVHFGVLVGSIIVLSNLERTYRAAVGTVRWRIKFLLLGVGLLFIVRIYTSSQALVLRSIDSTLETSNSGALLVGCLVMLRSLRRSGHFEMDVYPSPAVLRSSVTVLLTGLYLVMVGMASKIAGAFGNQNLLGLSGFLLLLSLLGLAVVLQSDRFKLKLRLFVSRNFQRPFYDYRTAWRTFTDTTATQLDQSGLCRALIGQVASLYQANSVSIWLTSHDGGESLVCAASSSLPETSWQELAPSSPAAAAVIGYFRERKDPVEFEALNAEWAETLRRCNPKTFNHGGGRVAIALSSRGSFLGLLIVGDRVEGGGRDFGTQDFDMLHCVAEHIAGSLLNIRLGGRLLESRELEAFQAMATFFVHDLKNAASTLNLMLPNLPIHWDNPEFREDALRGITKTVGHINSLIKRMGELRTELKINPKDISLNPLVKRALEGWKNIVELELTTAFGEIGPVRCDPEQVLTVLTNLILNARDATLAGPVKPGRVHVSTRQEGTWAVISVADNGCGMTRAFLSNSLFRPFQTTKKNGLGIGMFQSKMIVEAHGGRLLVESAEGKGTTFQVYLPSQPAVTSPPRVVPPVG